MAWTLSDNFKGRFRRIGLPGRTGAKHPCWKGGKVVDRDGYIRVWVPNHPWPRKGYVGEHVVAMELQIGRWIKPTECVHHKDGNRQNNALENLELLDRREHSRQHRAADYHTFKRGRLGRFTCGHSLR